MATYDFLLEGEDVVIEEFVEFFIGVVDTKLLERVCGEIFKTENIQHAQKSRRILARVDTRVDVIDEPRETPRV